MFVVYIWVSKSLCKYLFAIRNMIAFSLISLVSVFKTKARHLSFYEWRWTVTLCDNDTKTKAPKKYSRWIHRAQYLLRRLPSLSLPLRRQPVSERDWLRKPSSETRMEHSFITESAIRSAFWSITSSPSNAQSPLECEQVAPDARRSVASIGSSLKNIALSPRPKTTG